MSHEIIDPSKGLAGLASRMAFKAMITTLYVKDLLDGKVIESREILEIIAIETQTSTAQQS